MKKKIQLIIIGLVCTILILIISISIFNNKNNITVLNVPLTQKCPTFIEFKAINLKGDITQCDCLTEKSQKIQCQINVNNASFFDKAILNSNLSLCDKITSAEMKNNCISLIKSKLDFISKLQNSDIATSTNKR